MQFLNYFLASLVSFLGLITGILLVKMAPEEQKPLRKHFLLAKKISLMLLLIFPVFFYIFDKFSLLLAVLLAAPALLVEFRSEENPRKIMEIYAIFGVIYFLSSPNANLLAIVSSLIFIYGTLASGVILNKNEFKIASSGFIFLAVSSLLFLLNYGSLF